MIQTTYRSGKTDINGRKKDGDKRRRQRERERKKPTAHMESADEERRQWKACGPACSSPLAGQFSPTSGGSGAGGGTVCSAGGRTGTSWCCQRTVCSSRPAATTTVWVRCETEPTLSPVLF